MSEDRVSVRVSKKVMSIISEVADDREVTAGEAADALINTAWNRIRAVRRDEARRAAGKPTKFRKVTVKTLAAKPKKASKPKAAKKAKKPKAPKPPSAVKRDAKKAAVKSQANGAAAHA